MSNSKFRIKKTELNNGEWFFTPQQRLAKNHRFAYILLTIFFPCWFIVIYFLFDKAMTNNNWSVFSPYKWVDLSPSCCYTLLQASNVIVIKKGYDKASKVVQNHEKALKNGLKVKNTTIYKHPEL